MIRNKSFSPPKASLPMSIVASEMRPSQVSADWLIVMTTDQDGHSANIQSIDQACHSVISAMRGRGDFKGEASEVVTVFQASGLVATNLVLAGVGSAAKVNLRQLRQSLLAALRQCCKSEEQTVAIAFDDAIAMDACVLAELAADCITSAPVDADIYKAKNSRHPFSSASICLPPNTSGLNSAIETGVILGESCWLVKDLVNRSADDIYPETFANEARALATEHRIEITVLDEEHLRQERMGAMLAVARGSSKAPRLVKMSYRGRQGGDVIGICGKGVTFDSGGYSLKPSDSMVAMKSDMAGAATTLATVVAAARLKLPVNINAYMGLAENMISGDAYRLGDVLTARNGTTIEVHNTDAEGRLVLADVLSFAADDGVNQLVDMATLTGACVVALGEDITGVFPNNDALADRMITAADKAGEFFWKMPMHAHFEPLLKSPVADCKNVGPRWGGAVTAAKFLEKFVGDVPWVHLDIAGPSWADSGNSYQDSGATGAPVRSLIGWLRS